MMQINVIIFGQLTEITGNTLLLNNIEDTDSLIRELNGLYPALADKKYAVAVDKQVINQNTILKGKNTVALLPPFSGG
jgi:molybdopterin synthase sulfur carrier subunit